MDPQSSALALPFLGMLCLTMLVWVFMFIRRLGYATANNIDAEAMKTPEMTAQVIPADVGAASNNLKNLFELPVLFYAVCLYLMSVGQVDSLHVNCAWVFLGFRALHSLIHCSYNTVMHRFIAYLLSSIALWVMVVRAMLAAL